MSSQEDLRKRIDFLEETYEYLLSYAARGLTGQEATGGGEVRDYLSDAAKISRELPELFRDSVQEMEPSSAEAYEAYVSVLRTDAENTARALDLVLVQEGISSQLVDNLNASIHFRALLTDLFLIDEIFNPRHQKKKAAKG